MDGGRTTRAMSRAASEQTTRPVPGTLPVTPPTPRRSSIWQLSRRAREAEEEAAAAAAAVASPAAYVQAFPQITTIPVAPVSPKTSRPTSPKRPRSRPLEQPNHHVRETLELKARTTPDSLGPSLPTPPTTIEGNASDTILPSPGLSITAAFSPAPSAPTQSSPVEDVDTFAASAIQIGIDEWIASEQRRQIAANAAELEAAGIVQRQVENPMVSPGIPIQGFLTTQSLEPASVLDSEWLASHQNTSSGSGLRFAQLADLKGFLGPGLENITGAYFNDQDPLDVLPASILSNPPNDIWNPFQSNFEHLTPIPATINPSHLSLPFNPQTQTQRAPTPPPPSGTAPTYHVSNLCVDPSCPITHTHQQGLYVERPERPRMWNVCWGYSDPPEEIWEALVAMARGRASGEQMDAVHGFSGCHFWPGTE